MFFQMNTLAKNEKSAMLVFLKMEHEEYILRPHSIINVEDE